MNHKYKFSLGILIGLFLLIGLTISTGIAVADDSDRNAVQINDDPSLWITHAVVDNRGVSSGEDTNIRFTLQNTGDEVKQGTLDLQDINMSGGNGYLEFYMQNHPAGEIEYNLEPGERTRMNLTVSGEWDRFGEGDSVLLDRGPHRNTSQNIESIHHEDSVLVNLFGGDTESVWKKHIRDPNPQEDDSVEIIGGEFEDENGVVEEVISTKTYKLSVGNFSLSTAYFEEDIAGGDIAEVRNGHIYEGTEVQISDINEDEEEASVSPQEPVSVSYNTVSRIYESDDRVEILYQDSDHVSDVESGDDEYYESGETGFIDTVNISENYVILNDYNHQFDLNQINTPKSSEDMMIRLNGQNWIDITLYEDSSAFGSNSITPSGERQTVTVSFDKYKDNSSGLLGAYTDNIPPVSDTGTGDFEDDSLGRVFNFFSANERDDSAMILDTGIDEQIYAGLHAQNLPDSEYYSIAANYQIPPGSGLEGFDKSITLEVVDSTGSQIDSQTTYKLNDRSERETRYFQLSEQETEYVQSGKNLYVTLESDETQMGDRIAEIYSLEVLTGKEPLVTTSSNLSIEGLEILDGSGDVVTDNPQFETNEVIQVQYDLYNYGSATAETQVSLYEDGQFFDTREVSVNPNERDTVTFSFTKSEGGLYYYSDPVEEVQREVYVETNEAIDPIAVISDTNNHIEGSLITDPTDPEIIAISGEESFAPDGEISVYRWEPEWMSTTQFGETTTISTPSTQGTYELLLEVEDDEGFTGIDVEDVYAGTIEPDAELRGPNEATSEDPVTFDSSQTEHMDPYRCIEEYELRVEGELVGTNTTTNCGQLSNTITHSFETGGVKTVELTARDDLGNEDTDQITVNVDGVEPTATFDYDPNSPLIDTGVTFDASNSFSEVGRNIESYEWDFDDGETSEGEVVNYSFDEQGIYTVELTIEDEAGETNTTTEEVEVSTEPFNIVITGPDTIDTSDTVEYTYNEESEGINNIDSVEWRIDGEVVATDTNTIVEEFSDATNNPTIEVTGTTDDFEGYQDTDQKQVTLTQSDPIADISSSFRDGEVMFLGESITFDGSDSYDPDGTQLEYNWQIGDNNESSSEVVINNYLFDGPLPNDTTDETYVFSGEEYPVLGYHTTSLTVEDGSGNTDTDTHEVGVVNRGPDPGLQLTKNGQDIQLLSEEQLERTDENINTITYLGFDWLWSFEAESRHWENPALEIEEYEWNFEDGPNGTAMTSDFTWDDQNIYTELDDGTYVTEQDIDITLTGELGETENIVVPVRVEVPPLIADVEANPQNVLARVDPVELDGSGTTLESEAVETYEWDFGDGEFITTSNQDIVEHVYQRVGTFQSELIVTDFLGREDTDTVTVRARNDFEDATFLTCGQDFGRSGPSQDDCDSTYENTTLENWVNVDDGVQDWTVPITGKYRITIGGAVGGGTRGGESAVLEADFLIDQQTEFRLLVGQMGSATSNLSGGGGGTFLTDSSDNALMIAGGGGGVDGTSNNSVAHANPYSTSGEDAYDSGGDSGYGGSGGSGGTGTHNVAGGAGFTGDGSSGDISGSSVDSDALSFLNGGVGGDADATGGFGGGGAADQVSWDRGGGGGGYSGGGGARGSGGAAGGAGGSYMSTEADEISRGNYRDSQYSDIVDNVSPDGTGFVDVDLVLTPDIEMTVTDENGNIVEDGDIVEDGEELTLEAEFDGKDTWVKDEFKWYLPDTNEIPTGTTESVTVEAGDVDNQTLVVEAENNDNIVLGNDVTVIEVE